MRNFDENRSIIAEVAKKAIIEHLFAEDELPQNKYDIKKIQQSKYYCQSQIS